MNSRDILPVLLQYVPLAVTIIVALVGLAVRNAAAGYNTHITDVHVRDVVGSAVKQAEMMLGGNSAAKKQQVLDRLSVLLPWLSHADASRLIEAAVLDLNQFQALTSGAVTVLPAVPPLEPATVGYSVPLLPQRVIVEHVVSPSPTPTPTTSSTALPPLATITASSTAPQAVAPVDTLPSAPLPQG